MPPTHGFDELRKQGQMTWIEEEPGWVAAPEDVVDALVSILHPEADPYAEDGGEG